MQMQVEAYLNTTIDDSMEFRALYYRYAKVKEELRKQEEEANKRKQQRGQR